MTKQELKEITDDELALLAIDVEISLTGRPHRSGMSDVIRELVNRFQYQRGTLSAWKLSLSSDLNRVKLNESKCYPCDGLGYTIERVYEGDGSQNRSRFTCACCNGTGKKSDK
tara:strand:- start:2296 stop:2634 length:339 start_codon:yes stop_codon:yes gene_type:complete